MEEEFVGIYGAVGKGGGGKVSGGIGSVWLEIGA